jgi:5,10-methylenetetrahydromethanopterin reductase
MALKLSVQFATPLHSPEHIAAAEDLGYHGAWLFAIPDESPDVWMMLALAAHRTSRIGPGPGVNAPALRHPMVTAAATAALVALAPDRVAVAFGTDQHLIGLNAPDDAAWAVGSWTGIPTPPSPAALLT